MSAPKESKFDSNLLETKFFERILLPGDVLIFSRPGLFGWITRHATNGPATHCETYVGGLKTIASRDGVGVATYDLKLDGLYVVLRPKNTPNIPAMLAWQKTVDGAKYDWFGLLRSFVANKWAKSDNKWWCSEHTCEAQRQAGIEPFSDPVATPSDSIAPSDFLQSGAYLTLWKRAK